VLWLWLGVLDSLQGVGFGMILLHTLTRFHIRFTLLMAQVLSSVATICAREFAPDNLGLGPVFPNFGPGVIQGLSNAWFWVCLVCQLSICLVAFKFCRKQLLTKP
jgi:alpha-1,3-glucan synthase